MIEADLLPNDNRQVSGNYVLCFGIIEKWCYFVAVFYKHFGCFLVTALAISLGSPFWFDMLNKVMRLRTSKKPTTDSNGTVSNNPISPLNRDP